VVEVDVGVVVLAPVRHWQSGWRLRPSERLTLLLLLCAACATGTTSTTGQPEVVPSHVYARPLDDVLMQSKSLLGEEGWRVARVGNILATNWMGGATGTLVSYRVYGQRIDAGFCTIRIERLVANPTTNYYEQRTSGHRPTLGGMEVPLPAEFQGGNTVGGPESQDYSTTANAAGLAPPFGMVVTQHTRDKGLELKLQEKIEAPVVATAAPQGVAPAVPALKNGVADTEVSTPAAQTTTPARSTQGEPVKPAVRPVVAEDRGTTFPGIWVGTFNFRGTIAGSYSAEISVAAEDGSLEFSEFCPDRGGTLVASPSSSAGSGSGDFASWQGNLVCPAIAIKECPSLVLTYNYATAVLRNGTLTVVASGKVDPPPAGCLGMSGEMSATFVAQKADYVHLSVSRTKQRTACIWPSDWEDFTSFGSMPMPEPPHDDAAFLGVIRAQGNRLTDIQQLLRHCRHLVLLHGVPVQMRLAATAPVSAAVH
jgi:hypothetical protein